MRTRSGHSTVIADMKQRSLYKDLEEFLSTLLHKKIEYWEHQLLDLGKRNKMIN